MDDLIYRRQAIDALDGELTITGRTNAEAVRGYVKLVKDRLERLPSVQPESKRGKWKTAYLDHESMGVRPKVLYCSECNQCIAYPTNFCPNCGADMRGEQDE